MRILVLHGPNLNLLGQRETDVYGTTTLQALNAMLVETAAQLGAEVEVFQSNHEGELLDRIQAATAAFVRRSRSGVAMAAGHDVNEASSGLASGSLTTCACTCAGTARIAMRGGVRPFAAPCRMRVIV